ncbi:multicopper oxidase family protein [Pseudarthrobacter sp. YS3]|uniref:multicopper oxidase family protein n=1 Tax=Pseudarthrobacter sp. YS3 TaxID=3453718 RepID=UPI003EEF7887
MPLTRRQLLQAGAVAGAGLLVQPQPASAARTVPGPAAALMFSEPLPTLSELGVLDMRAGGAAELWMRNARHSFHSRMELTDTFAYQDASASQTYLGPVILARRGTPFTLTVHNDLRWHPLASAIDPGLVPPGSNDAEYPRTSTHLHGGNTRPGSDGHPELVFYPGRSFTYSYDNNQDAAGLWYHDHALGITRLNVYAGLAGGYVLRDTLGSGIDTGDGTYLPSPPYEVPLVVQDRMFNPDGTFAYPPNAELTLSDGTPRPWAPEFFGDVATVNGKCWPNLDVARGKYRFRVYNGSDARFYNFKFVVAGNALEFAQIGTDGGLLDAPVRLNKLVLGPGERADIVVDFAGLPAGSRVALTNNARTPFPDGPVAVQQDGMPLPEIMQFTVQSHSGYTAPLPARLRAEPLTRLAALPTAATRPMTMVEVLNPAGVPVMALLNNRSYSSPEVTVVQGDTLEQWELINTTEDAHPIHLHFTQFQVLNRQRFRVEDYLEETGYIDPASGLVTPGRGAAVPVAPFLMGRPTPPPAHERGWKDTVVAMPGEVTRIRVPFGAGAAGGAPVAIGSSFKGEYVWHCHILEHEDNDMMQRYVIA